MLNIYITIYQPPIKPGLFLSSHGRVWFSLPRPEPIQSTETRLYAIQGSDCHLNSKHPSFTPLVCPALYLILAVIKATLPHHFHTPVSSRQRKSIE